MNAASIDGLANLEPIHTEFDLAYVPLPNQSEFFLTSTLAPLALTPTAFLFPFLDDGSLVMATNRRRGVEVPGGHREAGETAEQAAVREAMEETGCEVCAVRPVGFQRLQSKGVPPVGYQYPFPTSFQQIFAARVVRMHPVVPNDEVLQPTVIRMQDTQTALKGKLAAIHLQLAGFFVDGGPAASRRP